MCRVVVEVPRWAEWKGLYLILFCDNGVELLLVIEYLYGLSEYGIERCGVVAEFHVVLVGP